ncbi:MAG: hypothetical protein OXF42_03505, partial [Candidatus Dadabacteria bacterium]|nr:hypothetical protein [Candidatus Dadabacteria bacterium]
TLWGTFGFGLGSADVKEKDNSSRFGGRESDVTLITLGVGGSGKVFARRIGQNSLSIDAIGDFVFARISDDGYGGRAGVDANSGTARLGVEVTGSRPVLSGNIIDASLALAYRGDFGDAAAGSGLEVGGGLKFGIRSVGLKVDLDGRMLVLQSDDLKERGFSGDITWSPRGREKGPFVSFRPYLGATGDKRDTLWEQRIEDVNIDTSAQRKYELEFGYGMPLMYEMGNVKVFAGGVIEEGATVSRSGGLDIETGSGISAGYEAVDETSAPQVEHRAYIKFNREF